VIDQPVHHEQRLYIYIVYLYYTYVEYRCKFSLTQPHTNCSSQLAPLIASTRTLFKPPPPYRVSLPFATPPVATPGTPPPLLLLFSPSHRRSWIQSSSCATGCRDGRTSSYAAGCSTSRTPSRDQDLHHQQEPDATAWVVSTRRELEI
jgi:hypothetical protein